MKENCKLYRNYLLFIIVAFAFFIEALMRTSLNPLFHLLHAHFTATQIGVLASAFFFSYASTQLFIGYLLDRFATKIILTIALGILIVGILFMRSRAFEGLLFARILTGIGGSGIFLSGAYYIQSAFSKKYTAMMVGLYFSIGYLGGFASNLPFYLLVKKIGLSNAWLVCALIACIVLISILLFWKLWHNNISHQDKIKVSKPEALKEFWMLKKLWIAVIFIGVSAGLIDITTGVLGGLWGSHFLFQVKHISLTQAAFLSSLTFIGYILGAPFFGYLYAQIKNIYPMLIAVSMLIAMLYILLIFWSSNVVAIGFLMLVLGFLSGQDVFAFRLPYLLSEKHGGLFLSIANCIIMLVIAFSDILIPSIEKYLHSTALATTYFVVAAIFSALLVLSIKSLTRTAHL